MTAKPDDLPRQPLMEHLIELRRRLMIAAAAYIVAVMGCYGAAPHIYSFLVQPLADSFGDLEHRRLIYTGLTEAFFTYLKLAMFAGFFVSFPVVAAQLYAFLAPGLYRKEKRVVLPYLVAAPALFFTGAALCYFFVMPMAWKFFLGFERAAMPGGLPIQLEARVGEYLGLVMHMVLAFGVAFQLPVILVLLTQFGMINPDSLAKGRRFAIVIIAAASAIITPPDVFSMVALALPLYLLYEVSIIACRWIKRSEPQTEEEPTHA